MVINRWLGERTVHDVTLRGASTAPHQIDVLAGDDRQRALIECKYYDRNVGLPLIRNFFGAVVDLGCDLAAVVTTVGFTRHARAFAAAHDIELMLLRPVIAEDLEGLITSIQITFEPVSVNLRTMRVEVPATYGGDADRQVRLEPNDPTIAIEFASGRRTLLWDRYLEHHASFRLDAAAGIYPILESFDGPTWLVLGDERVPILGIRWEFSVTRGSVTTLVEHAPLVTLVDDRGDVLQVVSEEQLAAMRIVPIGDA